MYTPIRLTNLISGAEKFIMNGPLHEFTYTLPWANGLSVTVVQDNAAGRSGVVAEQWKAAERIASSRIDRWDTSLPCVPLKKAARSDDSPKHPERNDLRREGSPPRHPRRNELRREVSPPRHPRRQNSLTDIMAPPPLTATALGESCTYNEEASAPKRATAARMLAGGPDDIPTCTQESMTKAMYATVA